VRVSGLKGITWFAGKGSDSHVSASRAIARPVFSSAISNGCTSGFRACETVIWLRGVMTFAGSSLTVAKEEDREV